LIGLVGFVLAVVSLAEPWWWYVYADSGRTVTDYFVVGPDYAISCTGSGCGALANVSQSYNQLGPGLSALYNSVEGLAIAAVVMAGLAALFAVLAALGRPAFASQRTFTILFALGAGVLLLAAVAWVTAAQPGSFSPGATLPGTASGGPSPATSFWGSGAAGKVTSSWGAAAGWFAAILGGFLLAAFAIAQLFVGRSSPVPSRRATTPRPNSLSSARPVFSAPPRSAPPPLGPSYRAAPLVTSSVQAVSPSSGTTTGPSAAATIDCPTCGTTNLARSRTCSYCQRSLREA
jgi:hypothetical protein